jgi:dipeptidyl aminopeptidase/acylaminoacyl peptidase
VSASGGQPRQLTSAAPKDATHRWPQLLPGGKAVIFTAGSAVAFDNNDIRMVRLDTGATTTVVRGGYFGRYLPTSAADGVLLYVRGGAMFGVPFDPNRGETHGTPIALLDDVAANPNQGRGQFDFSSDGTFVYASGHFSGAWIVSLVDATGTTTPLIAKPNDYVALRYSRDGSRLATSILGDIWIHDLARDIASRVTYSEKDSRDVAWAPDDQHIAYQMRPSTGSEIWWTRADGGGQPQLLFKPAQNELAVPMSFSPDGRRLAFFAGSAPDIFLLPLDLTDPEHPVPGKPEVFLQTPFREAEPMFSPDGRWIAYQSDESGRDEIYVRPYPGPGVKIQISNNRGVSARWSRTAPELFFVGVDGRLSVVRYSVNGDRFEATRPTVWADVFVNRSTSGPVGQDIAADGKHFAVIRAAEDQTGQVPVVVLMNFVDEVRRRMADSTVK